MYGSTHICICFCKTVDLKEGGTDKSILLSMMVLQVKVVFSAERYGY